MEEEKKDLVTLEKETTAKEITEVRNSEEYKALIDDITSDIVETQFGLKQLAIELNHRIGRKIVDAHPIFDRAKVYGKHIVNTIAQDAGKNPVTIYYALQFYRKHPNLDEYLLTKPKTFTWSQAKKELPDTGDKPEEPKKNSKPEVEIPEAPMTCIYDKEKEKYVIDINPDDFIAFDWSKIKTELIEYLQSLGI